MSITSISIINEVGQHHAICIQKALHDCARNHGPHSLEEPKQFLLCLAIVVNIFWFFNMCPTHQIPGGPHPYCFAIPSASKPHSINICRIKAPWGVSPGDCWPLGRWKRSSFQMKGTRNGGEGRPWGRRVPRALFPRVVLVRVEGIWRMAPSWRQARRQVSSFIYTNR